MLFYQFSKFCFERFLEAPSSAIIAIILIFLVARILFGKNNFVGSAIKLIFFPVILYVILEVLTAFEGIFFFGLIAIIIKILVDVGIIALIISFIVNIIKCKG